MFVPAFFVRRFRVVLSQRYHMPAGIADFHTAVLLFGRQTSEYMLTEMIYYKMIEL